MFIPSQSAFDFDLFLNLELWKFNPGFNGLSTYFVFHPHNRHSDSFLCNYVANPSDEKFSMCPGTVMLWILHSQK